MRLSGIVLLSLILVSFSKGKIKIPEITVDELKKHISYLASDALKGRRTGQEGDSLAAEYIRNELKRIGLTPQYDKGFQRFRVTDKIINGPGNVMIANGNSLMPEVDFAPFAFSQNASFSGYVVFAGYGFQINEDFLFLVSCFCNYHFGSNLSAQNGPNLSAEVHCFSQWGQLPAQIGS